MKGLPHVGVCTGLSICSGLGGTERGIHLAVGGWLRVVAYVEREARVVAQLVASMQNGQVDTAAVWSDVRTICSAEFSDYVRAACGGGGLGILFGGIPCQPHSVAGRQLGENDPRDLWPATFRAVEHYRPWCVFIENVPGIIKSVGGLRKIVENLESIGYCVEAGIFSASETGASHRRERLFIMAVCSERGRGELREPSGGNGQLDGRRPSMGHSGCEHVNVQQRPQRRSDGAIRREGKPVHGYVGLAGGELPHRPPGPSQRDMWGSIVGRYPELAPAVADSDGSEETVESAVCGVVDGISVHSYRMPRTDSLRALGNAVALPVAGFAFLALWGQLRDSE